MFILIKQINKFIYLKKIQKKKNRKERGGLKATPNLYEAAATPRGGQGWRATTPIG